MKLQDYIKQGYDLEFLQRVQTLGGKKEFSKYIETGTGVEAVLTVYDYPTTGLSAMWLKDLVQQDHVIGFVGIESLKVKDTEERIEKGLNEKGTRVSDKNNPQDNRREIQEIHQATEFLDNIQLRNESPKAFCVKLFVWDDTEERLMDRVKKIRDEGSKFKMAIMMDEQGIEWDSVFTAPNRLKKLPNSRANRPCNAWDLAGGYFFDHTKLEDPNGDYMGKTDTGGMVAFDPLHRDSRRTGTFIWASGNPNYGVGTFAMALCDKALSNGHLIRNLNVDEKPFLKTYTKNMQGILIDLAVGNHKINIFQVFPAASPTGNRGQDEIAAMDLHIQKLSNIYEGLNKEASSQALRTFKALVANYYCQYPSENNPLWYKNPTKHLNELKATRIKNEDYPLLSNFIAYARQEYARERDVAIKSQLRDVVDTFEQLLQQKSILFEGATTFGDMTDERLVTFDFSGLVTQPQYLNVMLFSVLSFISRDIKSNGFRQEKYLRETKGARLSDVDQLLINVTDISRLLSPEFPSSSQLLLDMVSSMSQNYAGLIVQANDLESILGQNNGSGSPKYYNAMKKLFNQTTYRAIGNTGPIDKELLSNVLKGEISAYELDSIGGFEEGQLYLSISGRQGLMFRQDYLDDEKREYGGWH
ncbi:hypothetical protein VNN41_10000 [Lactococcus garvieae]|uniref:hypothetical protein n=1 Tax=Lactococcus garvieae TaxID=1363 RepID=UPI003245675F